MRNFVLLEMKCLLQVTQLLSDKIRIYVFLKKLILIFFFNHLAHTVQHVGS